MAQSRAVSPTVKTDNHPITTEAAVNLEDVSKGICNLVSLLKDVMARENDVERRSKIDRFFSCQPPSFGHDTDPLIAKNWIFRLEILFKCLGCSEEQKVDLAVLKLEDTALGWWVGMERVLEADGVPVTWEKFKEVFYERYFPNWLQHEKEAELYNLVQGDKTVAEYDAEFIKLSCLASPSVVANDEWRAMLFERGLRPEIRINICLLDIKTYTKIRELALLVERRSKGFQRD